MYGDSLWDPDFKGYLASGRKAEQGDLVLIEINTDSTLSFISASSDSKTLILEFSGGEYGNLLSFLPRIKTSGNTKLLGEEEIKLETRVVAVVQEIDENGNAVLEGSRSVEIDGKGESIVLTGTIAASQIGAGQKINFDQLAGARLVYKTLMTPLAETITEEDIIQVLSEMEAAETEGEEPQPGESPTEILPEQPLAAAGYNLSETRKKELLLRYINKLLDLIFE